MSFAPNLSTVVDGNFRSTKSPIITTDSILINGKQTTPSRQLTSQGQLWVTSTTPNDLVFTDNEGTEHSLSSGGSGGVSLVNTGQGLTGGPITTSGTISIPNAGISNALLANPAITINTSNGISGGGTVALGGTLNLTGTGSVPPAVSRTIYVTKYGDDTNDGSSTNPFASLKKAIGVANTLSTSSNPITIQIDTGMYIEINTTPLIISAAGISIVGSSVIGVIVLGSVPTNDLIVSNNTINIQNITFTSPLPLATGITATMGDLSQFRNIWLINFLVGMSISGSPTDSFSLSSCIFVGNGTGVIISGPAVGINESSIIGVPIGTPTPANVGMVINGASTLVIISGGTFATCDTALDVSNNASVTANAVTFKLNTFDFVQTTSSNATLTSCTFELTNSAADIDLQVSGAGTTTELIGCEFSGSSIGGSPEATGIYITDNALVNISSGTMNNYNVGIRIGSPTDTSSTQLNITGFMIRDSITNDIIQNGTSTLNFNASSASNSKILINNPTNVELAFFDVESDGLVIGSTSDVLTSIIQVNVPTMPSFNYKPLFYGTKAMGFEGIDGGYVVGDGAVKNSIITTDRAQPATLRLVSDEGSPTGTTSALRGWDITKNATSELAFSYQNTDIVGQSPVAQHTVVQLDGINNQLQLPASSIVFGGDTNLYRSAANILKTDSNFIINPLTPDRVVVTDSITNQLKSSSINATTLNYLSGTTSAIQSQLDSKVNKSGDTMTGALTTPTLNATTVNASNVVATTGTITTGTIPTLTSTTINTTGLVSGTITTSSLVSDTTTTDTLTLNGATSGTITLQAPSVVSPNYALSFPSTSPTIGQSLKAGSITATDLEWITGGGSALPTTSKTIYVAKYGNDTTGNGSSDLPFASLGKAITTANSISSSPNPITIFISAGVYIENNSLGPLTVTANGISIVGASRTGVVLIGSTPANNLVLVNNPILITNLTFQASSPLATGLTLSAGNLSVVENVRIINFLVGIETVGLGTNSYGINSCTFVANGTAVYNNDAYINCNGCVFFGSASLVGPPANVGLLISGSNANSILSGGIIGVCITGLQAINSSIVNLNGVSLRLNINDIVQNTGSRLVLSACVFEQTIGASDVDVFVTDAGTTTEISACEFNGLSPGGVQQGVCIQVEDGAVVHVNGGAIRNYDTGIRVGTLTDTSSTKLLCCSVEAFTNVTYDILQQGSSTLIFNIGIADLGKISIDDATNVKLSFADSGDGYSLVTGNSTDTDTTILQVNTPALPEFSYKSSMYTTQAMGTINASTDATLFGAALGDSHITAITTDRSKLASLSIYSDTGSPIGGTTALRGWNIQKESTGALTFGYQNSDIVGEPVVALHNVLEIDGTTDQVILPEGVLVFGADVNLYRGAANVLQTDDNVVIGTLNPNQVVVTDGANQLASAITTTELNYLSGVTSAIQTQLNAKLDKAGGTMTGTLQLPSGSVAVPSLTFTGSTNTGLSTATNDLSISTAGVERIKVAGTGVVTITNLNSTGVVHTNASGVLSTSLIVASDITASTITNDKLATATSSDTPSNIVVRDGSGNFATNMITIDGTVTNATDVATKSYVDSAVSLGLVAKTPALVVSQTNVTINGLSTVDGVVLVASDRVLLVSQTNPVENGLWEASAGAWTRPSDFASASTAGQAYVLILSGTSGQGSSWLCSTPLAVVDTDPITFTLFSLPDTSTGANVGVGTGSVFKSKTGTTFNFRTLLQGVHTSITTGSDEVTIDTDAASANTASTIVARDASGNFSAGIVTASLTGSASNNVLKAGDTMTGTLVLPGGSAASPSLTFTGNTNTGLSATGNVLSVSASGVQQLSVSASGVTVPSLTPAGVVHNSVGGSLTTSLIVNADVSPSANIDDTKLNTIATTGKVSNSATTATNTNTPSTIVARDASGNFSASTIVASLQGSASNNVLKIGDTMTGALQLPAGNAGTPSLTFTGSATSGLYAASGSVSISANATERINVGSGGVISISGFTTTGVVHNNGSGNLTTSLITNVDVDAAAGIVDTKLATIATANKVNNSATTATSANTPSAIVSRDGSGNFTAGTITANLTGTATNATNSTTAVNFSGTLVGDVTGTQAATVVSTVGGQTSANVAAATVLANAATSANTPNTIVKRDGSGDFTAGTITANLTGNASTATLATNATTAVNFSGSLVGDVTGTQAATVVSTVGGQTSTSVAAATVLANAATSLNTPSTIVRRDASGNFNAGTVIGSLLGSASNNVLKAGDTMTGTLVLPVGSAASPSLTFTGTTAGLSSASSGLSLSTNATERVAISSGGIVSVNSFVLAGVVHNDASGNLSTSLITNADIIAGAAISDTKLATITTAGKVSNSATTATNTNTPSTIVARDASGNFAAGMITLSGTTTNATDAATKSYVDSLVGGTSANTPNTLVLRDGAGSFSAQNVNAVLVASTTDVTATSNLTAGGNLNLTTNPSTSTAGNILKAGTRFVHNTGTNNTFAGINSGTFTTSGTGQNVALGAVSLPVVTTGANNTALGYNTLSLVTTGSTNIAIGSSAGSTLTTGSGNIYIGANASAAAEASITRIGSGQAKCFVSGIRGVTTDQPNGQAVLISSTGQMGTVSSSRKVKQNIQAMEAKSERVYDLKPRTFTYISDKTDTLQYGLIAEEVEEVFPELVVYGESGVPESVKYHDLPAILLNEVQEQRKLINKLFQIIEELKK